MREFCVLLARFSSCFFFRKATLSFVISVCWSVRPSACSNSAPTGRIFMKIDVSVFFEKSVEKKHQVLF